MRWRTFRTPVMALCLLTSLLGAGLLSGQARAADSSVGGSLQGAAQAYSTKKPLPLGTIVQLASSDNSSITAASYAQASKVLGVVVNSSAATVTLSSSTATNPSYVVTAGNYQVLVSNVNGAIKKGDYVGVSPISGIGMKADTAESTIIGRAAADFSGSTNVITKIQVKTLAGKQLTAAIGSIPVVITIIHNPQQSLSTQGVPNFVQRVVQPITGHAISSSQLYGSIAILLASMGIVAALMYGGIRSGMIAIGRNPLAQHTIFRNMQQVIVAGLLIFIGSIIGVYLILKL